MLSKVVRLVVSCAILGIGVAMLLIASLVIFLLGPFIDWLSSRFAVLRIEKTEA